MTATKLNKLKNILKDMKSVLIAYSGGVDSTFLLKIAQGVLNDRVLVVTAKSETYPEHENEEAKLIAKKMNVEHIIISTQELEYPHFSSNPPDRCYYCKKELFTKLKEIAKNKNIVYILDGTNYDDIDDFRPGMKALKELSIRSPLKEAGLTKEEIRLFSRERPKFF
jgi:uncharacterized protein